MTLITYCLLLRKCLVTFLTRLVEYGVVSHTRDAPSLCAVKPLTTDWLTGLLGSQPHWALNLFFAARVLMYYIYQFISKQSFVHNFTDTQQKTDPKKFLNIIKAGISIHLIIIYVG